MEGRVGAAEEEGRLTRRWVSELRRLTARASDPLAGGLDGERSRKRLFVDLRMGVGVNKLVS